MLDVCIFFIDSVNKANYSVQLLVIGIFGRFELAFKQFQKNWGIS